MKNPMYWKEYINLSDERVHGYFNKRFSDTVSLGRVKKLDKKKYEAVLVLEPTHEEFFETEQEAKEWVEQQMLLWVMKGNSLEPYLSNKEEDD